MIIELDPASKEPPYVQLKQAISRLVATEELAPGTQLPTIRQLAGDLDVAPNTVARAYRELEADGFLRSRGRRGTSVAPAPRPADAPSAIASEVDDIVRRARRLGLDGAAIVGLVTRSLARDP